MRVIGGCHEQVAAVGASEPYDVEDVGAVFVEKWGDEVSAIFELHYEGEACFVSRGIRSNS